MLREYFPCTRTKKALLFLLPLLCFHGICRNIIDSFNQNIFLETSMMDKGLSPELKPFQQETNKRFLTNQQTITTKNDENISISAKPNKEEDNNKNNNNKEQPHKNNVPHNHGYKMIPLVDRHWESLAPNVQVPAIPIWLQDYVDFHNTAIASIRNKTKTIYDYNYLVYSCMQGRTIHCYGTGNRQRAIAAGFVTAIATRRLFLIHDNIPVRLSNILSPNLIQWDAFFPEPSSSSSSPATDNVTNNDPTQRELPWTPVLRLNGSPHPFFTPSYFEPHADTFVMRYVTFGPGSVFGPMRSPEMTEYLQQRYNITIPNSVVKRAKKWIFNILFRPSSLLQDHIKKAQQSLRVIAETKNNLEKYQRLEFLPYVGVHLRMGNEGPKTLSRNDTFKVERYRISQLEPFYTSGQIYRQQIIFNHRNKTSVGLPSNHHDVPIIIVADENEAKKVLQKYDPHHVRYLNSTVIHAGHFSAWRLKAMVGSNKEINVVETKDYSNRESLRAMLKNWTTAHGSDAPILASHGLTKKETREALTGLVTMWSDILLLAQSSCIVESHSSFSALAESLSVDNKNGKHPCKCRQIQGLLYQNGNDDDSCADLISKKKKV